MLELRYGMIKKSKKIKIPYIIALAVLLLIAGSLITYHLTNKTKPIPTVNQYTKGQQSQSNGKSSSSGSSTSTTNSPSSTSSAKSAGNIPLVAPTGNFVSDHHPNLSGSPAPNTMTSVCNTSPGASCRISFTNGSTTKSLADQVTDAGGVTYWYWKLQDIGLTAGNWTITATSSSGGKSLSATDPMPLVVTQ